MSGGLLALLTQRLALRLHRGELLLLRFREFLNAGAGFVALLQHGGALLAQ